MQNNILFKSVTKISSRSVTILGLIGTIGGFINDVLSPLGNIATWMIWISLIIAVIAAFMLTMSFRKGHQNIWTSHTSAIFVVSLGSALVFVLWSTASARGPERGYLAENIEPIAQLQSRLLNLEEDVTAIRERAEETAADVEAVQETTADTAIQVEAIATAQALGFAEMQATFGALRTQQLLVDDPTTPQEWYSNARLYQLRGDTANAIRSYEAYFEFGLTFVDPYQEYVSLLKATEGVVRTRQLLEYLQLTSSENPALTFALSLLFDDPKERITRLLTLAEQFPQFGPIYDALSKSYFLQFAQAPSLMMAKKITDTHKKLFDLEEGQHFSRYFIDKGMATQQLESAEQRLAPMIQTYQFLEPSVQIFTFYTGINPLFTLPGATRLWVGFDDSDNLQETGSIETQAGTLPNTNNIGPILLTPGEHTLYYQYEDRLGHLSQLYSEVITVHPIAIQFSQMPGALGEDTPAAAFFMGVAGAEEGEEIRYRYSIDSQTLEQSMVITHEQKPISTADLTVEDLTFGDHIFYVQGERADGTITEVVEYPFTIEK